MDGWFFAIPSPQAQVAAGYLIPEVTNYYGTGGVGMVTFFASSSNASLPELTERSPALLPRGDLLIQFDESGIFGSPYPPKDHGLRPQGVVTPSWLRASL